MNKTTLNEFETELVNRLKTLDLAKVILFGSYACGTPDKDSDVDLYVVTKDEVMPRNYKEKRRIVRKVSKSIEDIREKVGIDLLVHTKAMNRKFETMNSSFSKELREKGIRLL
jgi:predicted nucleotidyltransferase